ncbi:unnamed protein product [Meloidogyne enterolobii]|uniref:Uncharacterized protein n=1 Tax=Meloidogyne enterolobii TaxID=390850 RepID=A0ACB0XPM6_MELEN
MQISFLGGVLFFFLYFSEISASVSLLDELSSNSLAYSFYECFVSINPLECLIIF